MTSESQLVTAHASPPAHRVNLFLRTARRVNLVGFFNCCYILIPVLNQTGSSVLNLLIRSVDLFSSPRLDFVASLNRRFDRLELTELVNLYV